MHDQLSTLTNIAFLITGLAVLPESWYAGICIAGLGLASMGYHAFKTRWWRHADVIMIYVAFLAILSHLTSLPISIAAGLGAFLAFYHTKIPPHALIAVLGGLTIAYTPPGRVLIVLGLFALWGLLNIPWIREFNWPHWAMDLTHSLSHIPAAAAMYFIFY
jgi:hypothetical protein